MHAVETIPGSLEALAVLDVLEEFPGTKAWISFQCQDGGQVTAVGEPIEDAFCALVRHRSFRFKVVAVGANCVRPKDVTAILTCYNRVNHWKAWPNILHYDKVPYVVYPNAGKVWDGSGKSWITEVSGTGCSTSNEILDNIDDWMKLGANIIGGCCQIGPEIIKQVCERVLLGMYDAVQAREEEAERTRNPEEEWSSVLERLKKPPEDNFKKKSNTDVDRYLLIIV